MSPALIIAAILISYFGFFLFGIGNSSEPAKPGFWLINHGWLGEREQREQVMGLLRFLLTSIIKAATPKEREAFSVQRE